MPQASVICDGVPIFTPETACHENCPILSKTRHIVIPKGVCATVEWSLRHPDGKTADLTTCFSETSQSISGSISVNDPVDPLVKVRVGECDGAGAILEVSGTVQDNATGTIRFTIPQDVYNNAGIYVLSMAIVDSTTEAPIFIDTGLLSVEVGLFGSLTQTNAPPTLADIRLHLRDTPVENDLTDDVEYDTAEILNAIVMPIHQWNAEPPPVAAFTCRTFPYKFYWRQAVVGELLRVAAHHYMRNNLKINHGGISGNFKDKYKEYLALAESYRLEWKEFVTMKKIELNASLGFRSVSSPYASNNF